MNVTLELQDVISLSLLERHRLISEKAQLVSVEHIVDDDKKTQKSLRQAFQISRVIGLVVEPYIQYKIEQDRQNGSVLEREHQSAAISEQTQLFADSFISSFNQQSDSEQLVSESSLNQNLYTLCETKFLARGNSITRSLSTAMGNLWELIANISPYAVSPELEFGVKIPGIDAIILTDKLEYVQLKTQKNTLTGSHVARSNKELSMHENSLFVACFDTGGHWTFNSDTIRRIAGAEFWSLIGMDYELLLEHVRIMLQRIDEFILNN